MFAMIVFYYIIVLEIAMYMDTHCIVYVTKSCGNSSLFCSPLHHTHCNTCVCDRREKSRGYVWNQDRHTPSSTPHHPSAATPGSAAVELPDGVKRRLWAAMTVLAQALSGCGEVSAVCVVVLYVSVPLLW